VSPLTRSSVLVAVLLVGCLAMPAGIAAADEELDDRGLYWQGTTLVKADYASNASEAALYTADGEHVRNISLDDGDLEIDTSNLLGKYYVTAPGASKIEFEVIVQQIRVSVTNLRLEENPLRAVVDVTVTTNRYDVELHVSTKNVDDFSSRVSGEVEAVDDETARLTGNTGGAFTYDLRGLGPGEYTLFADDADRDDGSLENFRVNETVAPPTGGEQVTAERGGTYWRPNVLVFENAAEDRIYHIETLDGERVGSQLSTTSGNLYVGTSGLDPGVYRVLSASNGSELTRFSLEVHELSATIDGGVVTIVSNRAGYDASLRIANDSTNVTGDVLQEANGDTVTRTDLAESEEIALFTESLAPGKYTVYLQATDSRASAVANFTVEEPTPTPTATPTATPTPSPTPTATASPTAADQVGTDEVFTETPSTSTTEATTTDISTPGFGPVVTVLVLVTTAIGLLLRQRR